MALIVGIIDLTIGILEEYGTAASIHIKSITRITTSTSSILIVEGFTKGIHLPTSPILHIIVEPSIAGFTFSIGGCLLAIGIDFSSYLALAHPQYVARITTGALSKIIMSPTKRVDRETLSLSV